MKKIKIVSVRNMFSVAPGARYKDQSDNSAEEFRERLLVPSIVKAIEEGVELYINLDGTAGYAACFLEEAFGGLVRENKFCINCLTKTLKFISNEEPSLIKEIWNYIKDAAKYCRVY